MCILDKSKILEQSAPGGDFFFIKTNILCKVIQGHLGAKICLIMLIFTTSSDIV